MIKMLVLLKASEYSYLKSIVLAPGERFYTKNKFVMNI